MYCLMISFEFPKSYPRLVKNKHLQCYHVLSHIVRSISTNPLVWAGNVPGVQVLWKAPVTACAKLQHFGFLQTGLWAWETAAVIWHDVVSTTEPLHTRDIISLWFVNHAPTLGWHINVWSMFGTFFQTISLSQTGHYEKYKHEKQCSIVGNVLVVI